MEEEEHEMILELRLLLKQSVEVEVERHRSSLTLLGIEIYWKAALLTMLKEQVEVEQLDEQAEALWDELLY